METEIVEPTTVRHGKLPPDRACPREGGEGDPKGREGQTVSRRPSSTLRRRPFLRGKLQLVQPPIQTILREQFVMAAAFADNALVEHQNLIGVLNR